MEKFKLKSAKEILSEVTGWNEAEISILSDTIFISKDKLFEAMEKYANQCCCPNHEWIDDEKTNGLKCSNCGKSTLLP